MGPVRCLCLGAGTPVPVAASRPVALKMGVPQRRARVGGLARLLIGRGRGRSPKAGEEHRCRMFLDFERPAPRTASGTKAKVRSRSAELPKLRDIVWPQILGGRHREAS